MPVKCIFNPDTRLIPAFLRTEVGTKKTTLRKFPRDSIIIIEVEMMTSDLKIENKFLHSEGPSIIKLPIIILGLVNNHIKYKVMSSTEQVSNLEINTVWRIDTR